MEKLADGLANKSLRIMIRKYLVMPLRLNTYAMVVEKALLKRKFYSSAKQLFILGLPRSGTTLIYQYIVTRLTVSYFTNGVGRFPGAPCLTTFLQHKIYGQYQSDFKSNYGKVTGPTAPREAGGFWNRFFDIDRYAKSDDLTEKDVALLRNTVACVSNIFNGAPFVNKNVKHLLRIKILSQIFPNSIFLIVHRSIEDIALSLLRGRYKVRSDPTQWWSVRPPDYDVIKKLPVTEQIANQCLSLASKMEKDLAVLPENRVLRIHYEDFCTEPELIIHELGSRLSTETTNNPPQTAFPIKKNYPESHEEITLLQAIRELQDRANQPS